MGEMTPEQRRMMEQLGLGNMAPSAPGPGSAAPQSARPASGAGAGHGTPSSQELHTENLTQMVQKHHQALGYDTGGTSGELTLETTIAISQFQAEMGMEVTGEVSPQLAGLLSAEVDKRRGN
jgi:peptidoglycan hydrolase-like protein with peptidoglycan-binding domain